MDSSGRAASIAVKTVTRKGKLPTAIGPQGACWRLQERDRVVIVTSYVPVAIVRYTGASALVNLNVDHAQPYVVRKKDHTQPAAADGS